MKKGSFNHGRDHKVRARQMRSDMSLSEKLLWSHLRRDQLGFRFRRQVPIDVYYLDFYCSSARLCVEVDGEQHEFQREYDANRDRVLKSLGVETLRIPSKELFEDGLHMIKCLEEIERRCWERARTSFPQPPSSLTNQSEEGGSNLSLPQNGSFLREGVGGGRSAQLRESRQNPDSRRAT